MRTVCPRSSRRQHQAGKAADPALIRRIDELHLEFRFAGSRQLRDLSAAEGRIGSYDIQFGPAAKSICIERPYKQVI